MEFLTRTYSFIDKGAQNSKTIYCAKKGFILTIMCFIIAFLFLSGAIFLLNSVLSKKSLTSPLNTYLFGEKNASSEAIVF